MPFPHSLVFVCALLVLCNALPSPTADTLSRDADSSEPLVLSTVEGSRYNTRSVGSIAWSCVSTIVACCWVAVHPNMIEANATRRQSTLHRLKHMVWMIIAPELIICWAMRQWVGVRNLRNKTPYKEAMQASYIQSHSKQEDSSDVVAAQAVEQWSETHGFFLQMGGFVLEGTQSEILSVAELTTRVAAKELALPNITAKELNDRSKRDAFSKTVAIVQTTWFLTQCLTRKIQGLVTTELELVTVAFAALNVFIYFFWWNKPLDVQTTVPVPYLTGIRDNRGRLSESIPNLLASNSNQNQNGNSQNPPKRIKQIYGRSCSYVQFITLPLIAIYNLFQLLLSGLVFDKIVGMVFESRFVVEPGKKRISTFYALDATEAEKFIILACAGLIGVLFGGIHCVGWDYIFPSHAEVMIWRISSIIVTAIPAFVAAGAFGLHAQDKLEKSKLKNFARGLAAEFCGILGGFWLALGVLGLIPYLVARVLLLVGAIISLRDLPPDALLEVRWTSFLPHV